jgi:phenylpropionate dioxygenase-like ring-hydroxylating dioxygenase large terminal subunit
MPPTADALYDMWYLALPGSRLRRRQTVGLKLLGHSILVGRDGTGSVFALRDSCPHRGIPLSHGKFDGAEVECCYHGWRFDRRGVCTYIPSLLPTQVFDVGRVRVREFPCREVQGNVWVYLPGEDRGPPDPLPDVPLVPGVEDHHYRLYERARFRCTIDQAVSGLVDPAHGPFVHRSWWWRTRRSIREKTKAFAPSHLGFTMVRHRPSANSRVYRLLFGREVSTEIRFELPGVRVEHIRAGRHHICGLTAITPLTESEVELHQVFYWTVGWLTALRPALRPLVRRFIGQDRDVMEQQGRGLIEDPPLMLINDADKPVRWYFRLKEELLRSRAEGRPFVNPVPHATLSWRT